MKRCPKCNKQYDDSWGVCLSCSVPLIDASAAAPQSEEAFLEQSGPTDLSKKICPKCHKSYDSSWEACLACGVKLVHLSGGNTEAEELCKEIIETKNTIEILQERATSLEKRLDHYKKEAADKIKEKLKKAQQQQSQQKKEKPRLKEEKIKQIVARAKKAKEKIQEADMEKVIAKDIFGILGTAVLAFGMCLFIAVIFERLPLIGRVALGYLVSSALIVSGHLLEKKDKFRNYGRTMLGGGWALAYFVTYAIHHVPAARLIENPLLGLALLLIVSAGAIAHILRYKSEIATCFAYLLTFIALMTAPVSVYTLIAVIPIALSLLFFMYRFKWYAFGFYGIFMTYTAFCGMLRLVGKPEFTQEQFFVSSAFLVLYWTIFTIAAFLFRKEDDKQIIDIDPANGLVVGIREMMHLLNGAAATIIAYILISDAFAIYTTRALVIAAGLYLVVTGVEYRAKRRVTYVLTSSFLIGYLIALSFVKYTGYPLTVSHIIIAQLIFLAGILFKETYWRMFASISFMIIMGKFLLVDHVFIKNALLLDSIFMRFLVIGFIFIVYPLNHVLYLLQRKRGIVTECEESFLTVVLYSYPVIYAIGVWLDLPKLLTAPAWVLVGVMLLQFGVSKNKVHFRIQGYMLCIGAFIRLLLSNLTVPGAISVFSYRLLSVTPVLVILFYSQLLLHDKETQNTLEGWEKKITHLFPYMIFTGIMLLSRYEAPRHYVAPLWAAIALVYAVRCLYPGKLYCFPIAAIAAIFASGRAIFVNLVPGKYLTGAEGTILIAVITTCILYAGNLLFMFPKEKLSGMIKSNDEKMRTYLLTPKFCFALATTVLVSVIISMKLDGFVLTFAWGIQAIIMLLAGFFLKEKDWRWLGLILLIIAIIKVFFVDLIRIGGNAFSSLILLGVILLIISGIYSQLDDKIKKAVRI